MVPPLILKRNDLTLARLQEDISPTSFYDERLGVTKSMCLSVAQFCLLATMINTSLGGHFPLLPINF